MGVWSSIVDAIPAIAGAYATWQQGQAQQEAYEGIGEAAERNVEFIAEQGALGAEEIEAALQRALEYDPMTAAKYIQPYAETGGAAYEKALQNILTGKDVSPYTESIAGAGEGAVTERQEFKGVDPAIMEAIGKEARYTGSGYSSGMDQVLLGLGREGMKASGDIAGMKMRKSTSFGDLERGAGLSKANILLGQVAPTLSQMQTGTESRLLSDISNKQMINELLGQGAYYVGSQDWGS